MGYDLTANVQPPEVTQALQDARDGFGDYGVWGQLQRDHHCYWRESIWSMPKFRAVIEALDMLDYDRPPGDPDATVEGRIPVARLSCNSGWLITSQQCLTLASRLEVELKVTPDRIAKVYVNGTQGLEAEADKAKPLTDMLDTLMGEGVGVYMGHGAEEIDDGIVDLQAMHAFFHYCATDGDGFRVW